MKILFQKFLKCLAVIALLAAAGTTLDLSFGGNAWKNARERMPETSADSIADAAGTGTALGILGGFRTVLADFAWLRAYVFWEQCRLNDCETLCALARTLDPQNNFFWENSINYCAYDFPNWIIQSRGGWRRVSEPVQADIHRRAYERGLKLVNEWAARFPKEGKVWTYAAQMCIVKTSVIYGDSDFETALDFYERAMICEKTPWFACLAYANITRTRMPARKERSRKFLQNRLEETASPQKAEALRDALEILALDTD